MERKLDLVQNKQKIKDIIAEKHPLPTEDEKKQIDLRLCEYPCLKKLVGNNPDLYKKYSEFRYKKEIIEDSINYPSFRNNDYHIIKKIVSEAREYSLGGLLLDTGNEKSQLLQRLEDVLKSNSELYGYNYQTKICNEPFEVHSEFLVCSILKKMGYLPEHEPQLSGTTVRPDFQIRDSYGKLCFIEVKTRHYSLEEVKQFLGLSPYLPQTGFVNIEEDTRKTDDVCITASENQISPLNLAYPDIPVVLVIESLYNIDGMQLNLFGDGFEQRCTERNTVFPNNLKLGVVFTAPPDCYLNMYSRDDFQHDLCQKISKLEIALSKARKAYSKKYGTEPFHLDLNEL